MEIELSISLNSDIGCVRTNNEDMILVSGERYRDDRDEFPSSVQPNGRFVAAVADGMGGHNAGEVASEIALRRFDDFIVGLPGGLSDTDFRRMIDQEIKNIHNELNVFGVNHTDCFGLGTTLVAWITYDNRIYTVNCGDSRIYRLRNGMICQLTVDHSEQNRQKDSTITSNIIYNCLGGGGGSSFVDIMEITGRVYQNDIFLICSDGVSDMLSEDDIENCLNNSPMADDIVSMARAKGGEDNISAITLIIKEIR